MTDSNYVKFMSLLGDCANSLVLKNVVFSSFHPSSDVEKIKGELKKIGNSTVLQFEYKLKEGRLIHKNVVFQDINSFCIELLSSDFRRADINLSNGCASYMVSKKGKTTFINNIKNKSNSLGELDIELLGNNKEKHYLLSGKEDFLIYLGVSDNNGRIHDKKQSKFRQICKFLENIASIVDYLPKDETIYISDLCCGKSYLSFAVYYYFTYILKREIYMECVDLKDSVVKECKQIAQDLNYSNMIFKCQDISKIVCANKPNLVISLHACDIATDIVLDYAIKNNADVVLSTPCCHRALSKIINCKDLEFISDNSILKSKFCEAATDSLRIMKLKAYGYRAEASEFIDPEDTPKNTLIKAIKNKDYSPTKSKYIDLLNDYKDRYKYLTGQEI